MINVLSAWFSYSCNVITFLPSCYRSAEPFGYNEVTMIPAGATHIRVTDNSKNYLGSSKAIFPVSFEDKCVFHLNVAYIIITFMLL